MVQMTQDPVPFVSPAVQLARDHLPRAIESLQRAMLVRNEDVLRIKINAVRQYLDLAERSIQSNRSGAST